jgi:hypothetical protein
MKRGNEPTPKIPPFIDQWGNPTHENPSRQYPPNPALNDAGSQSETETEGDTRRDEHAYAGRTVEPINERRTRTRRRLRRAASMVTVFIGVFSASAAYGMWSIHGTGSGSSKATTLLPVTATGSLGGTNLIPDGSTRTVNLTVTNPNNFQVKIVSVTGGTITAANGCTPTGVTFTNQTGLGVLINANATNVPVPLAGAASMSAASANACQGTTFTIPVTIAVQTP